MNYYLVIDVGATYTRVGLGCRDGLIDKKISFEDSSKTTIQLLEYLGHKQHITAQDIQIAKAFGASIITTAGNKEKANQALKLGADFVIRYDEQPIGQTVKEITGGEGVDIVIEHTGESTWADTLRAVRRGGKIVTCGATTGPNVQIDLRALFIKHQQIIGSTMGTRRDLIDLIALIEEPQKPDCYCKIDELSG